MEDYISAWCRKIRMPLKDRPAALPGHKSPMWYAPNYQVELIRVRVRVRVRVSKPNLT
jgi:hypothetical protein